MVSNFGSDRRSAVYGFVLVLVETIDCRSKMWHSISSGVVTVVAVLITVSTSQSTTSHLHDLPELPPPLAPSLITDCPLYHIPDPESPDGPCICDVDICPAADCLPNEFPVAVSSSTSCCPTYQCLLCSDEDIDAKRCRCSATMTPSIVVDNSSYVNRYSGRCECLSEEQSWDWSSGCQCDSDKCRLPDLCLGNSVEVKEKGECCEHVKCVECPEDSIAQIMDADSEIEAKCVCRACPEKVCSENEVTVIRKPGKNTPNICCDLYDCIERGCTINGTKYDEGDQWTIEMDTQCRCKNSIALCNRISKEPIKDEVMNCLYNGNSYRDGDVWTVDQCTNCTCHSGQSKCIAHQCMQLNESVTYPTTCAPSVHCELQCAEFDVDMHGCQLCECKYSNVEQVNRGEGGENTTDNNYIKIIIIGGCIFGIFVVTMAFYIIRRKCKRMRYYPETKHNLLLNNNNTSRDIYTSTTKPEDHIILPLYKANCMENTRN